MIPSRVVKVCGAAVPAAVSTLVLASPATAHVAGAETTSGWSIALAVAGVLAAAVGIVASLKGRRRPGLGIFVGGIVLLSIATTGFSVDTGPRSSPTEVEIVEPAWGATVTETITVRIDLRNGTLVPLDRTSGPPTEGHLHLYANGRAIGMFDDTEEVIELPPGRYLLQAEFTGADHKSFSPFVADSVEIEVVGGG